MTAATIPLSTEEAAALAWVRGGTGGVRRRGERPAGMSGGLVGLIHKGWITIFGVGREWEYHLTAAGRAATDTPTEGQR